MRVLLDECLPKKLGRSLVGHVTRTVAQEGWSGNRNGILLALMAGRGFEVLLTVDRSIPHQQKLQSVGVAVVILVTTSNRLSDLLPLVPGVLTALSTIRPGHVVEVRI